VKIRSKTFLIMALLLVWVAGGSSFMLIRMQQAAFEEDLTETRAEQRTQLQARAQLVARSMRSLVERALPEHQLDLIAREMDGLRKEQEELQYGILMDLKRRAMVHPDPSMVTTVLDDAASKWAADQTTAAFKTLQTDESPMLEIAIPILQDAIDPETGEDTRERAGTLRFGFTMASLEAALDAAGARNAARIDRMWQVAGALSGTAVLGGLLIAFLLGTRLSRPIERLTRQAEAIADGRLDRPISVRAGTDEIGRLSNSFEEMRQGVQRLLVRTAEKARMEAELQTARDVQEALLPAVDPSTDRFQFAAFYQPATEMGGDWYAYLPGSSGQVYVVVGDVTGHGAAAALVAASARSAASTLARAGSQGKLNADLEARDLLRMLNAEILSIGDRRHMMTCAAVRIDLESGAIEHANAAHNKPIIVRGDGSIVVLPGSGPVLGDETQSDGFPQAQARLEAGDTLLLYTDGLIENCNDRGKELGRRRLVRMLAEAVAQDSAESAVETLRAGAMSFYGEVPLADDVTFVVVRALERE